MGRPSDDAAEVIGDLIGALGMPRTLRDVGVRREHYDFIANGAMQNMMVRSNPRPITEPAQVKEILDLAW
jgi:alcohol dehydrogenase class IV